MSLTHHDLISTDERQPGVLYFGGARMALLDLEAGFWGLRRQIEALVGRRLTDTVFERAGANGGASFARAFAGPAGGAQALRDCIAAYQAAGFGQFEIETMEWPIGRALIRGRAAFEAWTVQRHDQSPESPVCAYTAGVLVGFINVLSGRNDVVCIERACQAQGAEFCLFELLPASAAGDVPVVALAPDPALGRQINLLELLFERMPMGIAAIDRDYRIQRYNPTWDDFSDRYAPASGAALAPGIGYFDHLPGTESTVLPLFERVLAGETIRQEALGLELDGMVTYWDVVLSPIVEGGQVTGILNVAIDATGRVQVNRELERTLETLSYRAAFENIVSTISTDFINMPLDKIDLGIQRALQTVGQFMGVDRSYLFRFSGDRARMDCTHEWCAPAVEPQIDHMQDVPVAEFAWSNRRLLRGEALHVPRVADLPPEAEAERREFQRQDIRSLVAVPMVYRGPTIGFVGFDSVREEKSWSEDSIQLLRLVAAAFANALEHQRAQAIQVGQQQFLELLATGGDFSETLRTLVQIIEEQWPGMLGLVLLLDKDGRHLHIGASVSLPEAYVESIEGLEIGPRVGSCGTASYLGQRVIVEDIDTDERWSGLRALAQTYGLRACWSEPVFSPEGNVVGTFAMYYRQPRAPTEAELRTIETAAHLVGVAIEHKRTQEAVREAYETLEQRVEERTHELATLLQVSHDVNSTLELGPLLDIILDQLKTVVDYDGASILILDRGDLVVHAYRGPIPKEKARQLRFPLEEALVNRQVIRQREPLIVSDIRGDTQLARMFRRTAGSNLESTFGYVRSWLGVPLMVKGEMLGMLTLDHSRPGFFKTRDADLVLTFANQVAVAIENARLYEHAEESAVAAERNRLARDLHDAVTQTLFSASLIAEVLPRLWERDAEEGRRRLQELRELTRGALAEMRTLLLELRPSALVEARLADLLRQLAESITGRARVQVDVRVEGECDLEPEIKVALYRIAQEALNNVAKHAGATRAAVRLRCAPGQVNLDIQDDGIGFDLDGIAPNSLGLGIMRERTEAIGAALTVDSRPGAGAQISVVWRSVS
jgi:signal transduction histidine kinase/PAS domain-containing protein